MDVRDGRHGSHRGGAVGGHDAVCTLRPEALQARTFFSFGSAEEHCKYRDAVMKAYPHGRFPVFEGYNHMQDQIRDPQGFAQMLVSIMETGSLPELPFVRK